MYSYAPFTILLIINCRLIYEFKNRKVQGVESDATRRRRRAMNRTVIFVTFLFVIMTLPMAIVGHMYVWLVKVSYGQIIILICGRLSSSYQGYNIIFFYFTNQKFAQALRCCFSSRTFNDASTTIKDKTRSQVL